VRLELMMSQDLLFWSISAYHGRSRSPPYVAPRRTLGSNHFEDAMSKTTPRGRLIGKRKARRVIPRAKISRPQGNTAAVRKRLKKIAGLVRADRAKEARQGA
jgi:hypothetical protein